MRRRIGRFVVSNKLVESSPEIAKLLMGQMIILRCEYMYGDDTFSYTALCDAFEEVPFGEQIPKYDVTCMSENGKVDFNFNKRK